MDRLRTRRREPGGLRRGHRGRTGTVGRGPWRARGRRARGGGERFVDGAVQTDAASSPRDFLDDAIALYARQLGLAFVLWVPESNEALADEAIRRGGVGDADRAPAMSDRRVAVRIRSRGQRGRRRRAGPGLRRPGRAGLRHPGPRLAHDPPRLLPGPRAAPGRSWLGRLRPARRGRRLRQPGVGTARRGHLLRGHPDEHRGRGVAATATTWIANRLLEDGAELVVLQASAAGFPIYQRLGFEVYDTYRRFTFAAPNDA